ncbi:MAG TPA: DnaJ domain-containing protein [Bryobacteraceae bacterium]|nr:DnaJ domain-containing protein [Bryobacteraceae bacterium]
MARIKRREYRVPASHDVTLYWEDFTGEVFSSRPRARDVSCQGLRIESAVAIQAGTSICVEIPGYHTAVDAVVRYCVREGEGYRLGLEFSDPRPDLVQAIGAALDYYQILQINPLAEMETIHRVYRIMAARFHPDNPNSGDPERFLLLSQAYRVLSDPAQRAEYDRLRAEAPNGALPLFQARAFIDEKEGEQNRRLGVLCLLYSRRRRNPEHPTIGLIDLEELMMIPREYLEFTLWYLREKKYVTMGQSADFCLSAEGVDFVEEHAAARDLLTRLIEEGSSAPGFADGNGETESAVSEVLN